MTADPGTDTMSRNRWRNRAVGFSVWTVVGLSFGTRSYLQAQLNGVETSLSQTVLSYLLDFYLWGAVCPLIFYLCRRFPIERGAIARRFAFQFVIGCLFVAVVTGVTIPISWYLGLTNTAINPTFSLLFNRLMTNPFMLHQGFLAYWGTVSVAHAFEYYRQVQVGRLRAGELAAQLSQAQLAALKMQIHPHFLFNTLNSISALLHKDVEKADRMIARLSDFLRSTLKGTDVEVVTLAAEIEFLSTYLEIEKIRFGDRLIVDMRIEPEALDAKVPNLILQPLVENAIRHGVGRTTSVGRITIRASLSADRLIVEIEDNGPGPGLERITVEPVAEQGIGLRNTRSRLKRFFPNYVFDLSDTDASGGALVRLDVPYMT